MSTHITTNASGRPKTISEQADELEEQMLETLDRIPSKSPLYTMGEIDPRVGMVRPPLQPGQHMLQGADPRLPPMSERQLVEPYVDEEVCWAIRYHQALRFYPDESVGYSYPEQYVRLFGADYKRGGPSGGLRGRARS
jgi:hypothetical protein